MREAITRAVEHGQLSVSALRRRLPPSAPRQEGERPPVARGAGPDQMPLPLRRAERKDGDA